MGTLRALLPAELQQRRGAPLPAAVPSDMILDDTSSTFGQLDDETTLLILTSLPLREQLTCVTAVCRGWRALRNTAKSPLFTELNLLLEVEAHISVRRCRHSDLPTHNLINHALITHGLRTLDLRTLGLITIKCHPFVVRRVQYQRTLSPETL